MGNFQKALISEYAALAVNSAIKKAIAYLKASKHTMSGEDSGLLNTWDEICVQVQGEQSYFWDAYESAMRDAVLYALFSMEIRDKQSIWLQTEAGWDWHYDIENESISDTEMPVSEDDLVGYFVQRLQAEAETFTNARIRSFLYPGYE